MRKGDRSQCAPCSPPTPPFLSGSATPASPSEPDLFSRIHPEGWCTPRSLRLDRACHRAKAWSCAGHVLLRHGCPRAKRKKWQLVQIVSTGITATKSVGKAPSRSLQLCRRSLQSNFVQAAGNVSNVSRSSAVAVCRSNINVPDIEAHIQCCASKSGKLTLFGSPP